MIYKRFTEKTAEEWRQIYKALQLLEFLIKNGSERVIDDARSHLSLLKMLRQFHYIDQNGKDQGINVRNRAKELAELLSDVDRIRSERKKARTTRNKYGGYEGGIGMGAGMSSGGRFGGPGGDSMRSAEYGGYSGGVYGDGGGFGGRSTADEYTEGQSRRERFDEYDEYDEGAVAPPGRRKTDQVSSPTTRSPATKAAPPKPKDPEVDLFDFNDDPSPTSSTAQTAAPVSNGKQAPLSNDFGVLQSPGTGGGEDDFDDFQSATPSTTSAPAVQPSAAAPNPLFPTISPTPTASTPTPSLFTDATPTTTFTSTSTQAARPNYSAFRAPSSMSSVPLSSPQKPSQPANQPKPTGYQAAMPNYFGSVPLASSGASTPGTGVTSPPLSTVSSSQGIGAAKKPGAAGGDPFAALAMGGKKGGSSQSKGPTMADMAKEKATAGIWGASAPAGGASKSSGDLI